MVASAIVVYVVEMVVGVVSEATVVEGVETEEQSW